ncbi:hypothetical protein [Janibacter indicus]|uniref:Type II CBASS E2 protein domain-containing protein n=1 Tax=Janibacter indicus TaxID=857417 RepID=A0A1W2BG94_9MICO|nr:hypothetical protein [Janibacter indicus]SMC71770.1 hypothetical protein SAMN06296429_10822 [Janibacter indicus]
MTIAALLGHFKIDVPRYVTMDGQIVFSGVTASDSGNYTHTDHGTVSPVANHTFHGGEDEPADGPDTPTHWWDDSDALAWHIEDMKRCFPKFIFVPASEKAAPCWIGEIDTGRGKFEVIVVLRRDRGLPSVAKIGGPQLGVSAGRRWIPSPHLYLNGNLCVADRGDWRPDEHTAATATAWAAHWLAAYTEWRITRRWPVEGVRSRAA